MLSMNYFNFYKILSCIFCHYPILLMRQLRLNNVIKLAPKSHNFGGFKLVLSHPYAYPLYLFSISSMSKLETSMDTRWIQDMLIGPGTGTAEAAGSHSPELDPFDWQCELFPWLFPCYVCFLRQVITFSVPQFLYLYNGDRNKLYVERQSEQCLAHSKLQKC